MSEKSEESREVGNKEYNEKALNKNVEYYVKAFDRLEKTGQHTWNWAACLFGSWWMFYRKMYLYSYLLYTTRILWCCAMFVVMRLSDSVNLCWFTIGVLWILESIFTGYFGNYLYYNVVKKRIRKGYHLLPKYRPTSISSLAFGFLFVCPADWIAHGCQLKNYVEDKVNEETVRAYLNPNKKIHISVKIANVLSWLVAAVYIFLYICGSFSY